jgi:hypothetical protein
MIIHKFSQFPITVNPANAVDGGYTRTSVW